LLPSKKQHARLAEILESQRQLYNAAKQEREDCYRKTGKGRSYMDQCKAITELRQEPEFSNIPANMQRWTLKRCDNAYQAFFRRIKAGEKPGFPRYKGKQRWNSFGFAEFSGIIMRDRRVHFKGLPSSIRIHQHRSLPEGKILSCVFTRDAKGWSVSLQMRIAARPLPVTGKQIGIDVGLKELAVLSTSEALPNPRIAKRTERELRRRSRALSRCERGSNRRRKVKMAVTRWHARIQNARNTYLHQVSAKLVRENDLIAMEKLNIKAMGKGLFSKSIYDASWSKLKEMIAYKAESAGRQFIEVDPKNTTQACSGCGVIVPKTLKERWHSCPHCGLELDRDHNAAINILHRAVLRPGARKTRRWPVSAPGNLKKSARAS
jgi:putative transposase